MPAESKKTNAPTDPWVETLRLTHGGDRSFAHLVETQVLAAAPAALPALETKLVAILEAPEATEAAREFACRLLATAGGAACVPALVPLLRNPRLSHYARLALEPNPAPAAGDALRVAAQALPAGVLRKGVFGSLAARAAHGLP
ncbi:MAG: hypothetical protein LBR07_03735 [Puniceicoccales bacterium]|jgi:hypothetical protein|nr:hypothetical protein [Puniceicoccales bacterium]